MLIADHYEGNFSARQVLLITHVLVGCQQKLKPCGLSLRYQFAVYQPVPAALDGFNYHVTLEGITQRAGVPLSKSMSIDPVGGLLQSRGRVKAPRRELNYGYYLFMR